MKKWIKVLVIVLASIIALILLVAILISPIAKSYIEKNDKELLGREITIDKFKLNIFNGSLRIEKLNILEKDNKTKFVSVDTFKFNMKILLIIIPIFSFGQISPELKVFVDSLSIVDRYESSNIGYGGTNSKVYDLFFEASNVFSFLINQYIQSTYNHL